MAVNLKTQHLCCFISCNLYSLKKYFVPEAWIFNQMICKGVAFLQGTSVAASVFSIVAVAIDRFLGICCRKDLKLSSQSSCFIIAGIWLLSIVLNSPYIVVFYLVQIGRNQENEIMSMCTEVWSSKEKEKYYFFIVNLGFYFLVPLLIILICYGFILKKIYKREAPGEGQHNNELVRRSKIKALKMLAIVVFLFAISWFLFYTIFTLIKVGYPSQENSFTELLLLVAPIAQWLASANSCMNPIVYVLISSKFRGSFIAFLCG